MTVKKLTKGDKVDITWVDCYNPQLPSWADDDQIMELIKKEDTIAHSCGYFYCEYGEHIYIYGDKLDVHFSRITGIPKGAILKIERTRKKS